MKENIKIETLKRMRLRDGDVLVLKSPKRLTADYYRELRSIILELRDRIKIDFEILILEDGFDVEIINKSKCNK